MLRSLQSALSALAPALATLALVALAAPSALAPSAARAQPAAGAYGQYLVVIDDSGSMDRSDPRRLVELAALALAGALEDADQVMLVGLNELASGDAAGPRFVSPRELLPTRDAPAETVLPIDSERAARLATHHGETPCRAALDRARTLLDSVASAGAPQTLLMLTDGACNGGAVEPAERWLSQLRSHREHRFRFVLLMRAGPERVDRALEDYGRRTGWQGDTRVAFDARALLRAFADVLSFSRGLRYDEGGRVGLERTFAGARTVRVLAIRDRGEGPIALERVPRDASSRATPIAGGPTYVEPTHGWSFRTTTAAPGSAPFAVRSPTSGVDVLVVPVYGRLRVEAIVAPCETGEPPAPPWTHEVAVRAGQPACGYARLVGDTGETIVPHASFDFGLALCEDAACVSPSPMQAGERGVFHAQLGAGLERGRHERAFRASGGALAEPITASIGFAAMTFGVQRVARASEPERAISELDLGELPREVPDDLALRYSGAFPAGARGRARCEVASSDALAACVRCRVEDEGELALVDGLEVRAVVEGSPFCPLISEGDGEPRPVRMRLILAPLAGSAAGGGDAAGEMPAHALPITATLRYAHADPIALELTAGESIQREVRVPGPRAQTAIEARVEGLEDDSRVEVPAGPIEVHAAEDGTFALTLRATAADCCGAGAPEGTLVLRAGESELRVPLRLEVRAPSLWTCPGKQIALALAALLALALLIWLVHGFVSPARFDPGALLLSARTLDELLALREGDDGWRQLRRFAETKRGFRRAAAVWLGGPRAPLPSMKRQPVDGRIEAQPGGGATLIVTGPGVERWNDAEGRFVELERGSYPVASRVRLRRGEELVLELRR